MKYTGIFFCILFICCQSPEQKKILEDFKKVNESLEKNKQTLEGNTYEIHYRLILLEKDKHPELAKHADEMYKTAGIALQYVDKMEEHLKKADKTGKDESIATNLLSRGPQGDTLTNVLWNVYQVSMGCPLSTRTIYSMDSTLKEIRSIPVSLNWIGAYFEQTPSSAAVVLLEDIKNDVLYASELVMKDMAGQVKK